MGDNKENVPPICILLPMCIESEFDVFFNILRVVLSRIRLEDPIDNALKIGLSGEIIGIDREEIVCNWESNQSKPKQILQWKLLGFWANLNYPSLGQKIFYSSWKPPQRKSLQLIGANSMTPDEVDIIIKTKMKLRIYELSVGRSTYEKLKAFVKVPADVNRCNGEQVSPKVKAYDITPEHHQRCFDALRLGKFENSNDEIVKQPIKISSLVPSTSRAQNFDNTPAHSTSSSVSPRQELDANKEKGSHAVKRARVDLSESFTQPGCDTSRMVLIDIHKKIESLTKWLDPNVAGRNGCNDSEQLHVMVFKQKDDEIKQLKLTVHQSRMEIENLERGKSSLVAQLDANTALVNALKTGVESTSELRTKSDSELTAALMTINNQNQSIAQYQNTVHTLESEARSLKAEAATKEMEFQQLNEEHKILPELNRQIVNLQEKLSELTTVNTTLEDSLSEWKQAAATKENEIQQLQQSMQCTIGENQQLHERLDELNAKVETVLPELQRQIEDLRTKSSEASSKNTTLEESLSEWKQAAATKEIEIQQLQQSMQCKISENQQLKERLEELNGKVETVLPELQRQIVDLRTKSSEDTSKNITLVENLSEWKQAAATKEIEIQQLQQSMQCTIGENQQLHERLDELNGKVETVLPELQRQIVDLRTKSSEDTSKNTTLEESLSEWKQVAATKEVEIQQLQQSMQSKVDENQQLKVQLDVLNERFETILPELEGQIVDLQAKSSEATSKNTTLEESLSELRQFSATKEVEIRKLQESMQSKTEENQQLKEQLLKSEASKRLPETLKCRTKLTEPEKELIRQNLKQRKFGWIKFHEFKNCPSVPGFVYPPDEDGLSRAQKVTAEGSVALEKNLFFHYAKNIPERDKSTVDKIALKRLNQDLGFEFQ